MVFLSKPFVVGDLVRFTALGRETSGTVVEVGWYRTRIRSLEYEEFVVPNSVFANAVLVNVSRRGRVFRFFERFQIHADCELTKLAEAVRDFRNVLRRDERVIQSGPDIHRRVFVSQIR